MKNALLKTVAVAAIMLSGAMAQADVPAWLCNLNFNGVSKSVQIIIGKSEFNGKGTVRCVSASKEQVEFPVLVTMETKPIAPKIGLGKMHLYGEALQIALLNGAPESLLGNYLVLEGRAAVIGGVGVIAAVSANDERLAFNVSVQLIKGLGFDLGFRKMNISLDMSRLN